MANLKTFSINGKSVKSLFINGKEVKMDPPFSGFKITAVDDGVQVYLTKTGSPTYLNLEYSTNGTAWTEWTNIETPLPAIDAGKSIYLRGQNDKFSTSTNNAWTFTTVDAKKFNVSGKIMSLLDPTVQSDSISGKTCCFYRIFYQCTGLVDASGLKLPSDMASQGFDSAFCGCSELLYPPAELPATTMVGSYACSSMFRDCSKLVIAPKIRATTLASQCFEGMFDNSGISSIEFEFTKFTGTYCCNSTMKNCSNLKEIKTALTAFSSSSYSNNWVQNVSPTGTFYCPSALGTNETIQRGNYYCPVGWTVINTDV